MTNPDKILYRGALYQRHRHGPRTPPTSKPHMKTQAIIAAASAIWDKLATTEPTGSEFKSLIHTIEMKLGKDLDDLVDSLEAEDILGPKKYMPERD